MVGVPITLALRRCSWPTWATQRVLVPTQQRKQGCMKQKEGLQNSPPPGGAGVELSSPKELMSTGLEARPENLDPSKSVSPCKLRERAQAILFCLSL